MHYFKVKQLYTIIILLIIVNAFGLFFPLLRNDDPLLYANIAKNMVLNHDWLNLTYHNEDWLDKPHFPFWVTAVFYHIFGINSFAYILPGFLFNLLGAYYTYRLAQALYNDDIGLLSCLIYLSSFHLMLSSIDVRAEAYLMGSIVPACYYWYRYNLLTNLRYLLLGSLFTAIAIMSKGLFVLIPIAGGLIAVWSYTGNLKNIIRPKWLIAIILSFIFVMPEIISLYIQFDMHPQKVIFDSMHISGIRWFLWDSQLGRFLNYGPIMHRGNDSGWHYIFFIHTLLWSFLPWSGILIIALFSPNIYGGSMPFDAEPSQQKIKHYYLLGSFLPIFILFSISKFQLDYYINILLPFLTIICANWLFQHRKNRPQAVHRIFYFQIWLAIILVATIISLSILVFGAKWLFLISLVGLLMLILFIAFMHQDDLSKAILYPTLAISLVFIFSMLINGLIYAKYDLGYQAALYLQDQRNELPLISYKVDSLSLEFYAKNKYLRFGDNITKFNTVKPPYNVILSRVDLDTLRNILRDKKLTIISYIHATTIDMVIANLLFYPRLMKQLQSYVLVTVK